MGKIRLFVCTFVCINKKTTYNFTRKWLIFLSPRQYCYNLNQLYSVEFDI